MKFFLPAPQNPLVNLCSYVILTIGLDSLTRLLLGIQPKKICNCENLILSLNIPLLDVSQLVAPISLSFPRLRIRTRVYKDSDGFERVFEVIMVQYRYQLSVYMYRVWSLQPIYSNDT